jgi:hypothetical protein
MTFVLLLVLYTLFAGILNITVHASELTRLSNEHLWLGEVVTTGKVGGYI